MLITEHTRQHGLPRHPFAWLQIGQFDKALEDYTAALEADPRSSYALYNRGILNDRLGCYAAAIKDFSAAIEMEPGNSDFFHNRGYALRKLVSAQETSPSRLQPVSALAECATPARQIFSSILPM